MSNDADQEYGPTPPGAAYEHTDIEPGVGYRFALWLAVAMALSAAFVYGIFVLLGSQAAARDRAARVFPLAEGVAQDPPSPRLQTQPFKDVFQLKSQQRDVLTSYGWVDKANGVAHIPIARAMELTLQRGLPARAGDDPLRSTVVQDSSGGRTTSGR